ncbi:MAG: type II and III secretion system protein family protein [Deltaproteobacteria bacterium]|nr:type II and III secretion system protein family protein [Deltaproteobacteria bacterium]
MLTTPAAMAAIGGSRVDKLNSEQLPMRLNRGANGMADTHEIEIRRGNSTLLTTAYGIERVAVGDPTIVDFVMNGNREIQLVAKNVGDTNVLIWSDGRLQSVLDIHVGTVHQHVIDEIRRVINNPTIDIEIAGSSIILTGWVSDLNSYERAEAVAKAFLGHTDISTGKGKAEATSTRAERNVINLIEVGGNQQVMIEVVIAELQKTIGRSLGVNMFGAITLNQDQQITFQTLLKNLSRNPEVAIMPGAATTSVFADSVSLAGTAYSSGDFDLRLFLEAVEASQLGTILAEPTVAARSGELASLLVGGEVPIPILSSVESGGEKFSVKFKKFGVRVDFTPTVQSDRRIHMQLLAEVSEPDFSLGVRLVGTAIPAFKTRRVDTSVDLGDGQSFAVAGLLREDVFADLENFPGLGSVPILGQLFRSRSFQKKQTELVIIITPRLVKPLTPGDFRLPTDQYIEPSKSEFYWGGLIQGKNKRDPDEPEENESATNESAQDAGSTAPIVVSDARSSRDYAATSAEEPSSATSPTSSVPAVVVDAPAPDGMGESEEGVEETEPVAAETASGDEQVKDNGIKLFGEFGHRLKVPTPTEDKL